MKQFLLYFIMMFIMILLVMVGVLISVAFLTLMERKFLGYIQIRKGPNKLGMIGLVQPFSDAIKLLSKESVYMVKINFLFYLWSPMFSLILILMMWLIYPFGVNCLGLETGLIYLMCCFSLGVYGSLMAGWSSNSLYSLLGSIRSLAQSISYEVSLAIIMIIPMILVGGMSFKLLLVNQLNGGYFIIFLWPLSVMFFLSIMAELNRTPFDFSEGESELVSGFNVEYGSVGFVMIFLAEYASILFLSFIFSLFYLGGDYDKILFYWKVMGMSIMIIWLRGTLPRFRYDMLMYLCWLMILPLSLNFMFYIIFLKLMVFK